MILAFGEVMLRLTPEGYLRFSQALPGRLEATFGGGEANVCASLAMLGDRVAYLTALPDNPIAQALIRQLRGIGVGTDKILMTATGRLGVYFLETGANQRSSNVVYDRAGSAISQSGPDDYDFETALEGVHWLHVTGITPALGEKPYLATLELVRRAKSQQATVSCDLNFRKKLWHWRPGTERRALARECMSTILPFVDVVIGNEEDASDVLDIRAADTDVESGTINAGAYQQVAETIVGRFPNVGKVAITLRESISACHNNWGAMLYDADEKEAFLAPLDSHGGYSPYEIRDIVDRVGGGDSFSAGLIHALNSEDFATPEMAIRFAVAASCLKHSIKGDFNCVSRHEVEALVGGQTSGRVRR